MRGRESERNGRFEALFQRHVAEVVAYCRWRADSTSDAEEAVAEVFLTAWRRLDDIPGDDAARVWLYATARRVIANQRRSTRRRAALAERVALTSHVHESPDGGEERALVQEALRRLAPLDREVLLLSEWEGLSPAQIATVLRCPKVTARGRLHRARRRFRSTYEELVSGEETGPRVRSAPGSPTRPVSHVLGGGS